MLYTLPSGTEVELRPMTGVEEDILTDPRQMGNGAGINTLIKNCLVRLEEKTDVSVTDVLDLLAGDRLFILVRLRQISLGDEVVVSLNCPKPHCRKSIEATINLNDLTVTPYPTERSFSTTLPSGTVVSFVHINGHKEAQLAALDGESSVSSGMLVRIVEVDGKTPNKQTLTSMSMRDRQALRDAMINTDGGIDTVITGECPKCGTAMRTSLEGSSGFFFPNGR